MGEGETIEVAQAPATRLSASRTGRVSMPPRRLEQELNEAAKAKTARTTVENKKAQSQRTSDNGEDSGMINDQLSLILRVVQDQAE